MHRVPTHREIDPGDAQRRAHVVLDHDRPVLTLLINAHRAPRHGVARHPATAQHDRKRRVRHIAAHLEIPALRGRQSGQTAYLDRVVCDQRIVALRQRDGRLFVEVADDEKLVVLDLRAPREGQRKRPRRGEFAALDHDPGDRARAFIRDGDMEALEHQIHQRHAADIDVHLCSSENPRGSVKDLPGPLDPHRLVDKEAVHQRHHDGRGEFHCVSRLREHLDRVPQRAGLRILKIIPASRHHVRGGMERQKCGEGERGEECFHGVALIGTGSNPNTEICKGPAWEFTTKPCNATFSESVAGSRTRFCVCMGKVGN